MSSHRVQALKDEIVFWVKIKYSARTKRNAEVRLLCCVHEILLLHFSFGFYIFPNVPFFPPSVRYFFIHLKICWNAFLHNPCVVFFDEYPYLHFALLEVFLFIGSIRKYFGIHPPFTYSSILKITLTGLCRNFIMRNKHVLQAELQVYEKIVLL